MQFELHHYSKCYCYYSMFKHTYVGIDTKTLSVKKTKEIWMTRQWGPILWTTHTHTQKSLYCFFCALKDFCCFLFRANLFVTLALQISRFHLLQEVVGSAMPQDLYSIPAINKHWDTTEHLLNANANTHTNTDRTLILLTYLLIEDWLYMYWIKISPNRTQT